MKTTYWFEGIYSQGRLRSVTVLASDIDVQISMVQILYQILYTTGINIFTFIVHFLLNSIMYFTHVLRGDEIETSTKYIFRITA